MPERDKSQLCSILFSSRFLPWILLTPPWIRCWWRIPPSSTWPDSNGLAPSWRWLLAYFLASSFQAQCKGWESNLSDFRITTDLIATTCFFDSVLLERSHEQHVQRQRSRDGHRCKILQDDATNPCQLPYGPAQSWAHGMTICLRLVCWCFCTWCDAVPTDLHSTLQVVQLHQWLLGTVRCHPRFAHAAECHGCREGAGLSGVVGCPSDV